MQLPYTADDRRDGIVGLAFAIGQVAQLLLMCDRHDIGVSIEGTLRRGLETSHSTIPCVCSSMTTTRAASASASRCSGMHDDLLEAARRLIAECECESGCPGCVGPIGNTGPLAKTAALRVIDLMLVCSQADSVSQRRLQRGEPRRSGARCPEYGGGQTGSAVSPCSAGRPLATSRSVRAV